MFYIIETEEQLEHFLKKEIKEAFIEIIPYNNNTHPALNELSLIYIRAISSSKKGYIISYNHSEALSIGKTSIEKILKTFDKIYVRNYKTFIYYFPNIKKCIDISFYINNYQDPITNVHKHYNKNLPDINRIIPISKHYEYCEDVFHILKPHFINKDINKYYNKASIVFFMIENNGLYINKTIFNKHYDIDNEVFNITNNNIIYSNYNLYTLTGRPSNTFNGINFAAINKTTGCRTAFIPKNDKFIEYDFKAYHPTLIAKLVGFDLKDETPYEYLARETNLEIDKAKLIMLKCLYGGIYEEYKHLEYFKKVQEYIDKIWKEYNDNGFIICPISGHVFEKDKLSNMNPTKLLSYIIQNLETSNNVNILWDILKILRGKNTQIVLYTYDSILIDYDEGEEELINSIEQIFLENKLKVTKKYGKNYEFQ